MAKKKQKKAAKRAVKRAGKRAAKRGRVVAKRAARKRPEAPVVDRSLPVPNIFLVAVDSLKLTIEDFARRWEAREQQRENERVKEMAAFMARLDRIELAQQAPPRDPSLDVPASVDEKRRLFAGFCKTMNAPAPTPAIIGRVMHDGRVFSAKDSVPPRNLFERIYAKDRRHLAPKICEMLERYGDPSASAGKKAGKSSSKIAENLGDEFDQRFTLIMNIGCGRKDPVQTGKKTNYHRYLTETGRELFDDWPNWTDKTGGIGIVDEGPASRPSEPKAAGTADPKPEPTPTPAPEPDAGAEPTSPAP